MSTVANNERPVLATLLRIVRNPVGSIALFSLIVLVLAAIFAPLLAPHDPLMQNPGFELLGPGTPGHPLGTDELGRDLLSRLIYGSRVSILVSVIATLLGGGIGVVMGLLSGYIGGLVDSVLMGISDILLALPAILIAVAVVTVIGPGTWQVAVALAPGTAPIFARLTRSIILSEREREYVLAARALGASAFRIMIRHILPNSVGPLLVQTSLTMGFAVLSEAALSFLGLGAQPPGPSWGSMLNTSRAYLRDLPWYGIWPGLALAWLVFALTSLAESMRAALDPNSQLPLPKRRSLLKKLVGSGATSR